MGPSRGPSTVKELDNQDNWGGIVLLSVEEFDMAELREAWGSGRSKNVRV